MPTNTTANVTPQHQHSFGANGKCSCGKTFDEWRLEAENAFTPAVKIETPESENS